MTSPPESPTRRSLNGASVTAQNLLEQLARLVEQDLPIEALFASVLERLLTAVHASAGAVWLVQPDGFRRQHALRLDVVGLDEAGGKAETHAKLLHHAAAFGKPLYLPAAVHDGQVGQRLANPTDYPLLIAPIAGDDRVVGLIEVFHANTFDPTADPAVGQAVVGAAALLAHQLQNRQRKDLSNQQRLWQQLETFARDVHTSLDPAEVASVVANEGLRLTGGDRLCVAVRHGSRIVIEAVSGTDRVEKNSNLVHKLRVLCKRVMDRGEKLVFSGVADESLPPDVFAALNDYLGESQSRLLVVLPLMDKRDIAFKNAPRSALVLEAFSPTDTPDALASRLDVLGRHAVAALYNSVEHRQIPFRLVWQPALRLQKGLGGKARAITIGVTAAVIVLVAALLWVPYPLKMDAKGQLLPESRSWVYAPVEGQVLSFAPGLKPAVDVVEGQSLILMHDGQLELRIVQLQNEITAAQHDVESLTAQFSAATTDSERKSIAGERKKKEYVRDRKRKELQTMAERTHADLSRPGHFWVRSPQPGTVLNWDFRENLTNRQVKPSDPLIRVGDKTGAWEIELKIPHKHVGQVLRAFPADDPDAELDVDILLLSAPTRTFKGKLTRKQVGGEATPNKDDPTDAEPVLLASVRLDGPDIDEEDRVPPELLVPGTEVHAKVRCGKRRLGYSLFYGVWEFFFEKVVFFF